jgi:hypothetical protein
MPIQQADNIITTATTSGQVTLPTKQPLTLHAICAKTFKQALIAVNDLTKRFNVLFIKDRAYITKPQPPPASDDVISLGILKNGTYHLDLTHVTAAAASAIPKQHYNVHATFNHQALPYLRRLMRIVPRAMAHRRDRLQPATRIPDTADCPPCHIGKQTRVPFQADLESAQGPLRKVQADTTGPIEPPDLHCDRYSQVMIDAATKNTVVDFLKTKSAATKAIP